MTSGFVGAALMGTFMVVLAWAKHTERLSHATHLNVMDSAFVLWPLGAVFIVFGALGLAGLETLAGLFIVVLSPVALIILLLQPRWIQPAWRRLQQAEEDQRRTERRADRHATKTKRRRRR